MNKWTKLALKAEAKQRKDQTLKFCLYRFQQGTYVVGTGILLVAILIEIVSVISLLSL